jgi:hypothetical protein
MHTFKFGLRGTALAAVIAFAASTGIGAAAAPPPIVGPPNLGLASSLIASGGGPGSYSTVRAFDAMIGPDAFLNEEHKLTLAYGDTSAGQFVEMFDYAMADAWKLAGKNDLRMPPPAQSGGQALASELIRAGITRDGTFHSAQFFIALFGPAVAVQLMDDINERYGPGSAAAFDRMGNQFFYDVAQAVGTNVGLASNH